MALAANICVDFGSSAIRVGLADTGTLFTEASCALVNRYNAAEVFALGREAARLEGRTDEDSILVNPVSYGGIADTELAAMLLISAAEKATGLRRPFERARLVLTMPAGLTRVERAALVTAAELAGAKHMLLIKAPVAAAVGAGLRIDSPSGRLVVLIGGRVTEISIISLGGIAALRHLKSGAHAFDEAIIRYIRREKGLIIGYKTAEELKMEIGSAAPGGENHEILLRGRSITDGRPATESVTTADMISAVKEPLEALTDAICDALYNVPPELTGDILTGGILLSGGGTKLDLLPERLKTETKLPVAAGDKRENDVLLGAMRIAEDDKLTRLLLSTKSAYEV